MADQMTLSNTSTWLPLDDLARGFDENKAELSHDLDGRTVTVTDDRGTRIVHTFAAGAISWDYQPGASDATPAASNTDRCEVFKVDNDLYYAQFQHEHHPREAVSLFLDLHSGWALSVIALLGEKTPEHVAMNHVFAVGRIEGHDHNDQAPTPTNELIGRRVLWEYSQKHAYEHVYLSPHWYSWHCLAGPERGLADTDENSTWRLRPGIYVFTWREKVIPCGSVTVADHRDLKSLRSHGVLFGESETGERPTHFTFGAYGQLLSRTVHAAVYDPSLTSES